jgi:hypothetical protein
MSSWDSMRMYKLHRPYDVLAHALISVDPRDPDDPVIRLTETTSPLGGEGRMNRQCAGRFEWRLSPVPNLNPHVLLNPACSPAVVSGPRLQEARHLRHPPARRNAAALCSPSTPSPSTATASDLITRRVQLRQKGRNSLTAELHRPRARRLVEHSDPPSSGRRTSCARTPDWGWRPPSPRLNVGS